MKRIALALVGVLALSCGAFAQTFTMPPPAGVFVNGCVFQTTPTTLTTGQTGFMQCDNKGNILTTASSGGGTQTVQGNQTNGPSGVVTSLNVPTMGYNYVSADNGVTWTAATGLLVGVAGTPSTQVVTVQSPSSGGGFPTGATPITISNTGTTGTVAAALSAASSKTTYICGFSITADAVAGLSGNATVTGVITGTMTYIQGVGVAPAVASTNQTFNPCIPSSTTNTAITITSAAASTGGTTAVNAWGYQQ